MFAHDLDIEYAFDFTSIRRDLLDLWKDIGRTDLYDAIAELATPDADAPAAAWQHYMTEWQQIIEVSGILSRYRQLQAEAAALQQEARWSLDSADIDAWFAYSKTIQLFYDCLKLAYTPDRRAFEDRIFQIPS